MLQSMLILKKNTCHSWAQDSGSPLFCLLFADWCLLLAPVFLHTTILKDIQYISVFYIFGGTVILYGINTLLISVINGFKEFKKYVAANILGSIIGLLFTIVLAYNFGIYGALIAAVTYQSVVFILTLFLVINTKWFKPREIIKNFSKSAAVKLGHYSLMALVTAAVMPAQPDNHKKLYFRITA